jgi:hypothetical protein
MLQKPSQDVPDGIKELFCEYCGVFNYCGNKSQITHLFAFLSTLTHRLRALSQKAPIFRGFFFKKQ